MDTETQTELPTHNFDTKTGVCSNPDLWPIEFGPLQRREAKLLLAADSTGRWFFGYFVDNRGRLEPKDCTSQGKAFASRSEAIAAGLDRLADILTNHGDEKGVEVILIAKSQIDAELAQDIATPDTVEQVVDDSPEILRGRFDEIRVDRITANPENHRKTFDKTKLAELGESIRLHGLLQPIAIRRLLPDELGEHPAIADADPADRFEIILGDRRWRACQALGLEKIDAKVYKGATRAQTTAAALVENLQREKINPVEEAEGFSHLMHTFTPALSTAEVARRVGKPRSTVANALRLIGLPETVRAHLETGQLTPAHALHLLRWKPKQAPIAPFDWEAVANVIAHAIVEHDLAAAALTDSLPGECIDALINAKLLTRIDRFDLGGEFPTEVAKSPSYIVGSNGWHGHTFTPDHWADLVVKHEKKKARTAKNEAKEKEKQAARAADLGVKSLADLHRNDYKRFDYNQDLATVAVELVPSRHVLTLPETEEEAADQVTVLTCPDFAMKTVEAYSAARATMTASVVESAFKEAQTKIRALEKIEPWVLPLLLADHLFASDCAEPILIQHAAKAQGVELGANIEFDQYCVADWFDPTVFGILREWIDVDDGLTWIRLILEGMLMRDFAGSYGDDDELLVIEYCFSRNSPQGLVRLGAFLDREIVLPETTEEGRAALIAQVKAAPWYADEYAAAEAQDPTAKLAETEAAS